VDCQLCLHVLTLHVQIGHEIVQRVELCVDSGVGLDFGLRLRLPRTDAGAGRSSVAIGFCTAAAAAAAAFGQWIVAFECGVFVCLRAREFVGQCTAETLHALDDPLTLVHRRIDIIEVAIYFPELLFL